MIFIVGDIIELQYCRTPIAILAGRYEIIRLGPRAVKLWRLLGREQTARMTTLERTLVVPVAQLEMFQLAPVVE